MTDICPAKGSLVERELAKLPTQYREAARLQGYIAGVLRQIEEATRVTCAIPTFFDLNTAVGDQLTLIGKRMGVPRCHCVCNAKPVFGFQCEATPTPFSIVGFCDDGVWQGCDGVSDLCLNDDEVFRAHLKARRYQMLGLFDLESLGTAIRQVWGAAAWIPRAESGQVVLAPGRALTAAENERLAVTLRILPIAPGVRIAMHFGADPIAGFGLGWVGFCDSVPDQPVYGFECPEAEGLRPAAGFCEDAVWATCAPPIMPAGQWLCPVEIDPYACP